MEFIRNLLETTENKQLKSNELRTKNNENQWKTNEHQCKSKIITSITINGENNENESKINDAPVHSNQSQGTHNERTIGNQ